MTPPRNVPSASQMCQHERVSARKTAHCLCAAVLTAWSALVCAPLFFASASAETCPDVDVTFAGGPHTFADSVGSPWEIAQNRLARGLLNAAVVGRIERPIVYQPCGEELLVITNPTTLSTAARSGNGPVPAT